MSAYDTEIKKFSLFFQNLYENKIVYYERCCGVIIAQLEDIDVSPRGISAIGNPLVSVEGPFDEMRPPLEKWRFSSSWEYIHFRKNAISALYVSWTIWPDPVQVKKVEELVKMGAYKEAMELTLLEPEID